MRTYIKELLYLLDNDSKKIPWIVLAFLLSSLIDLAGLSIIVPYIALIVSPDVSINENIKVVLSTMGIPNNTDDLIVFLGIGMVFIFLLKTIIGILINKAILRFSFNRGMRLQSDLMKAYQNLPYCDYINRNSSEYVFALQKLTDLYQNVVQSTLRLISESIVGLAILIFLFLISGPALGLLIGVLGAAVFTYDIFFKGKVGQAGIQVNKYSSQIVQGVQEAMSGFKEVRVLHRKEYFYNKVEESASGYATAMEKFHLISTIPRYFIELLLVLFLVLMVVGSILVNNNLEALVPVLAVFGMAALRLMPSANMLIDGISKLRYARNGISILYKDYKIFKEKDEIEEDSIRVVSSSEFQSLSAEGLCFAYPGALQYSLEDISLQISSGESIGFIGASGSGKTTLIDVLLGLLSPSSGDIFLNGESIQENLTKWHSNVAYLPQQVFLIDSTLESNITLSAQCDESKLFSSLKQARLLDLAESLPDGVKTMIGENGVRLSGGQRQRVALARAFYHGRNVLVMDEATSALDAQVEREISDEIGRLKGEKTLIIVAHRITTLKNCDRIYRLADGKIVECTTYKDICNNEFGTQ